MSAEEKEVGLRILVADDEEWIRDIFVRILKGAGYSPRAVGRGDDALRELAGESYDLAIIDMQMPGLSAVDIIKRYRAACASHIPIIILTADVSVDATTLCRRWGVQKVLTKPIHRQRLLDEINDVMQLERNPHVLANESCGDAEEPLDQKAIARLAEIDDSEQFLSEVLTMFLVQARSIASQIADAHREDDLETVAHLVHKLEGSAGTAGASGIERVCRELRPQLSDLSSPHSRILVDRLEHAMADLESEIKKRYRLSAEAGKNDQ